MDFIIRWYNTLNSFDLICCIRVSQLSGFCPIQTVYLYGHYGPSGLLESEVLASLCIFFNYQSVILCWWDKKHSLEPYWSLNIILIVEESSKSRDRKEFTGKINFVASLLKMPFPRYLRKKNDEQLQNYIWKKLKKKLFKKWRGISRHP